MNQSVMKKMEEHFSSVQNCEIPMSWNITSQSDWTYAQQYNQFVVAHRIHNNIVCSSNATVVCAVCETLTDLTSAVPTSLNPHARLWVFICTACSV